MQCCADAQLPSVGPVHCSSSKPGFYSLFVVVLFVLVGVGCGGGGTLASMQTPSAPANPGSVSVVVSPPYVALEPGQTRSFTAIVQGSSNSSVSWSVNDTGGSTGTLGTISSSGVYTAPLQIGVPSLTLSVTATSTVSPSAKATSDVTVIGATGKIHDVSNFGATGDGTSDDTAAINSVLAMTQPGDAVFFPCGIFVISSPPSILANSFVTITGAGTGCTELKLVGSGSFAGLQLGGPGLSAQIPLATDTSDSTFTLQSGGLATLGIGAGSYVLISDVAVASNGPGSPLISNQEVVKVISTSGDTATIEGTFSHQFTLVSPYPDLQGCCAYAQLIVNPVDGMKVANLSIDGGSNIGSATNALRMQNAVNSEIAFLAVSNFLGIGNSGGILVDTGYKNRLHDIVCKSCGNGGVGGSDSVQIQRQSFADIANIAINNTATQSVFSFSLRQTHNSMITSVVVDAGGAIGRPIKLLRSSHNIINGAIAKNGTGQHNGISVTDISMYNTFNNCQALNNENGGIELFGNHNEHNSFNNCVSMFNIASQFGQTNAADGSFADAFTTVSGGTYCCARGPSPVLQVNSPNFSLLNADVHDDNGMAIDGVVLNSANDVIENNSFSGLPAGKDIFLENTANPTLSGNSTPDGTTPSGLAMLLPTTRFMCALTSGINAENLR
jgi:hypothetical protein